MSSHSYISYRLFADPIFVLPSITCATRVLDVRVPFGSSGSCGSIWGMERWLSGSFVFLRDQLVGEKSG